jgi:hypothetical protein
LEDAKTCPWQCHCGIYSGAKLSSCFYTDWVNVIYDFSLELETSLADAVQLSSSQLSSQIIRHPLPPSVFHYEFDNSDKFINDVTGRGSVHTAHGIMLQEVCQPRQQEQGVVQLQTKPRTGQKTFSLAKEHTVEDCCVSEEGSY